MNLTEKQIDELLAHYDKRYNYFYRETPERDFCSPSISPKFWAFQWSSRNFKPRPITLPKVAFMEIPFDEDEYAEEMTYIKQYYSYYDDEEDEEDHYCIFTLP